MIHYTVPDIVMAMARSEKVKIFSWHLNNFQKNY